MFTGKYRKFTAKYGMFTSRHGMLTGKFLFDFHHNEMVCWSLLLSYR